MKARLLRSKSPYAIVAAALLLQSGPALADHDWLSVTSSPRCAVDSSELARRVGERVIGVRNPDLVIEVHIGDAAHGTAARVRIARGAELVGSKRIALPTCEETLDAVAAVSALALSSEPQDDAPTASSAVSKPETSEPNPVARKELSADRKLSASRVSHAFAASDPGIPRDEISAGVLRNDASEQNSWRLLLAGGVDSGTLAASTAIVGAGVAVARGRGQLRATVWYGWPSDEANEASDESAPSVETTRADFSAGTLDYCHGVDRERWLAFCAGVDVSVARVTTVEAGPLTRAERTHVSPSFGPVAGVTFAYRALPLLPELGVSAQWPIAGEPAEAAPVAIRVTLAAGIPF